MKSLQSKIAFALVIVCSLFFNQMFAQGQGEGLKKVNKKVERAKGGKKSVKNSQVKIDKETSSLEEALPTNAKQKGKKPSVPNKADVQDKAKGEAKSKVKDLENQAKDKVKKNKPAVPGKAENPEYNKDKTVDLEKAVKEKSNNGNAYGKDKAGKTGKEFGEIRSEAAKTKVKAKKAQTEVKVKEAATKSSEARTKIDNAKSDLVKARKDGTISEADAKAKEAKIKRAEEQLEKLNQSIQKGKEQVIETN